MRGLRGALRNALGLLLGVALLGGPLAHASYGLSAFSSVSDAIDRSYAGATSVTHVVKFTTTTAITAAANTVVIDFSGGPFTGVACANLTSPVLSAIAGYACAVAANIATLSFTGALGAATAVTVTVTSTTNPSPGVDTSYKVRVKSTRAAVIQDQGTALVQVFASSITTNLTIEPGLTFTVTNTPAGAGLSFDLIPSTSPSDTAHSTALNVITNGDIGFTVTVMANHQLQHSAYANFVPNSWPSASTTVASAFSSGTGFGYSLNAGTSYLVFDSVTPRTVYTGAGPTGAAGVSQTVNYKAVIDFSVPAGIYAATLIYVATPTY